MGRYKRKQRLSLYKRCSKTCTSTKKRHLQPALLAAEQDINSSNYRDSSTGTDDDFIQRLLSAQDKFSSVGLNDYLPKLPKAISEDKIPLTNIGLLLVYDLVNWFSNDCTTGCGS